jgi:hypothetical protein
MTSPVDAAAHVRVLVAALGIPLTEAELDTAAARLDAKRTELAPLRAAASLLPAGAGAALFRAGGSDG